jgi:hypothetical protein
MPWMLVLALLFAAPGLALAQPACPRDATAIPDGPPLRCSCAAGVTGPVWGSAHYSVDSNICAAARHAGVIGPQGGAVVLEMFGARRGFNGTASNGVVSQSHFGASPIFRFPDQPARAQGRVPNCPESMLLDRGDTVPYRCMCTPQAVAARGDAAGTDAYSADSNTCIAALHAGAVGRQGGVVSVRMQGIILRIAGSTRNGVTSDALQDQPQTIRFEIGGPMRACPATMVAYADADQRLDCTCSAEATARAGGLWGSGPYTSDSAICRAALHAGVVTAAGGPVRLVTTDTRAPQPRRWVGSTRNGVRSADWDDHPWGFRFER